MLFGSVWSLTYRNRPGTRCGGRRGAHFAILEGTTQSLDATARWDRRFGLGHDIDDAADGAVAVENGAAVASGDFNALNAVERDRGEIETL